MNNPQLTQQKHDQPLIDQKNDNFNKDSFFVNEKEDSVERALREFANFSFYASGKVKQARK